MDRIEQRKRRRKNLKEFQLQRLCLCCICLSPRSPASIVSKYTPQAVHKLIENRNGKTNHFLFIDLFVL